MTLQAVVDAWITDLLANVSGLATVTTKTTHRYASWSPEQLHAQTDERHLAIWPNGDIETAAGLVAGSPPADLSVQSYTIVIWEEAASDSTNLIDDDPANIAWLTLYEAVRARLYVQANRALGDAQIMDTRFAAGRMGMRATARYMEFEFHVRLPLSYT